MINRCVLHIRREEGMKNVCAFFIAVLVSAGICWGQAPRTISYQGILKNQDGTPVENGSYTLTFNLYTIPTGGSPMWTEQQSVTTSKGVFSTALGEIEALNVPFDRQYWLGITVNEATELTPRIKLTASAYSMAAQSVADGAVTGSTIADGAVVRSINNLTDAVTITGSGDISVSESGNTLTITSNFEDGLTLPYANSIASAGDAFSVTNTGFGKAGNLWITNANSSANALMVGTNGKGSAISASTTGISSAGYFSVSNSANNLYALGAEYNGSGTALYCNSKGNGSAGIFNTESPSSENPTILAYNNGRNFAGTFRGIGADSDGIYVSVGAGNTGLIVSGGTKNAVVATTQGARKLYTEESSEVWFTDYGFATLSGGTATVAIDQLFTETVALTEPYHVFLQPYGDAQLYVSERTPASFTVKAGGGGSDVEFSYRIVAKRKGYETARLEHEPAGDSDQNLYPEANSAMKIDAGRLFDASEEQQKIHDERMLQNAKAQER